MEPTVPQPISCFKFIRILWSYLINKNKSVESLITRFTQALEKIKNKKKEYEAYTHTLSKSILIYQKDYKFEQKKFANKFLLTLLDVNANELIDFKALARDFCSLKKRSCHGIKSPKNSVINVLFDKYKDTLDTHLKAKLAVIDWLDKFYLNIPNNEKRLVEAYLDEILDCPNPREGIDVVCFMLFYKFDEVCARKLLPVLLKHDFPKLFFNEFIEKIVKEKINPSLLAYSDAIVVLEQVKTSISVFSRNKHQDTFFNYPYHQNHVRGLSTDLTIDLQTHSAIPLAHKDVQLEEKTIQLC